VFCTTPIGPEAILQLSPRKLTAATLFGLAFLSCASAQSVPSISSGGFTNGASYGTGALAPGSIASVFGNFPIDTPAIGQGFPLPTTLAGLTLRIDDSQPMPLFYVSPNQVDFQVPWELTGASQTNISVTVNQQTSAAQTLDLASFTPGIFSINAQGTGQGAILDSTHRLVDYTNPAASGANIEIYATGLGAVSNQPATGTAAPMSPLATTTTTPTVTIGGVSATVTFSGLAPGFAGVYQVNAVVPVGTPSGNAVPVMLSIGGLTSNAVTIAVSGPPATTNPVPAITSLSPAFSATGTPSQQITIAGTNFVPTSTVTYNGAAHAASFGDAGHLTITLSAGDVASPGAFPVVVNNPAPGGGSSNAVRFIAESGFAVGTAGSTGWQTFSHDAQHAALSLNPSQPLSRIHWHTPVDLDPQYSGGELLIHYGSPLVTPANTVIIPVKTGATEGFRVEAHNGSNGSLTWSATTDYVLPQHNWTPEFGPALSPSGTLYFPGAGGTIYSRDSADSATGNLKQVAFYGMANYQANPQAYNARVMINTPVVSDPQGNIYFGFVVTGSTPLGLQSGIARISASGQGTWTSAAAASGDSAISEVVQNCTPALNWNLGMLYIAVSNGTTGYLLALNSETLQPLARTELIDPVSGEAALLSDDGTASPFIGADGDVYFGVLENPLGENDYRGWLLHFNSLLSGKKIPGAFGWDDTPSLVPSFMVPSYTGSSSYLLMTKYNDYADSGGTGLNRIAVLDPDATEKEPLTGAAVMKEVLTILGPTPGTDLPGVKEWCINSAAVDPASFSIFAGSEDGKLYRWNLATNTFSQTLVLTPGIGEAYTPTIIGPDGTVYAINNATLFAVGQ
jgi:uncharacterized protein (TIGR03437 family)